MSVSPTSTSGSYSLPASPPQSTFDTSMPAPPYSAMPSKDELSLSNLPGSLPPYSAQPGSSSNAPIPSAPGAPGAKPAGMGMGGLILAGVAGIPGYFAGKNILKSHPVIGGLVGAAVAAIAGFIGWGLFAGSPKQPPQA